MSFFFFYPSNFSALCIGVAKCSFQSVIVLQLHSKSFARDLEEQHPCPPGTGASTILILPRKRLRISPILAPILATAVSSLGLFLQTQSLSPFTKLLTGDKFSFLNCSYQDLQ